MLPFSRLGRRKDLLARGFPVFFGIRSRLLKVIYVIF